MEHIKEDLWAGQNVKKKVAVKLQRLVMSGTQKTFSHWKNLSKELKTIESSNLMLNSFEAINKNLFIKMFQPLMR